MIIIHNLYRLNSTLTNFKFIIRNKGKTKKIANSKKKKKILIIINGSFGYKFSLSFFFKNQNTLYKRKVIQKRGNQTLKIINKRTVADGSAQTL
jgi:archaellum component FlaG (FlaF/FlaG flagellin family)